MRRPLGLVLVTVLIGATGALALTDTAGAGAVGGEGMSTLIVRKVVTGTGAPSTVHVACSGGGVADLSFDGAGNPTTSVPPAGSGISIVDGAWQLVDENPPSAVPCTFTETVTGGASSTSWTCSYSNTLLPTDEGAPTAAGVPAPPAVMLGCAAPAGAGIGPVTVTYGTADEDVDTQTSTVTFTNVFPTAPTFSGPAEAIVAAPAFTG